ncbi:MAG: hypothetical protein MET45_23330 [Nostoc sp. LLA-1]|nr:hypothetical protein [Cyanocohniella sp. LLY]
MAITILWLRAHSNQTMVSDATCAAAGFCPSLQAAINTASGDLTPILVRSASLR